MLSPVMRSSVHRSAIFLLLAIGGCAPSRASAPPQAPVSRPPAAPPTTTPIDDTPITAGRAYTDADVRFMQGMIAHHAQALVMTGLVPARTDNRNILLLAERIEVSQRDEIARMVKWLADRGEEVPAGAMDHSRRHAGREHDPEMHAEHHPGTADHLMMPGMLTPEQMAELAAATGADFDRAFLDFMIQHHEGALVMVAELFASPGAGQEPEMFEFAAEVDADQRMEIERMDRMRGTLMNPQRNP